MKRFVLALTLAAFLMPTKTAESSFPDTIPLQNTIQKPRFVCNEESFEKTMYVTAESGLNIRKSCSMDSPILSAVRFSDKVIVDDVSKDGKWFHVKSGGYMYALYLSEEKPKLKKLGTFRITFYCNCSVCCGKWAGGPTASGTHPKAGRTIAVDPSIIPLGSTVYIDGQPYIAEDTGSSILGNRIDIYVDDHQEALDRGIKYTDVLLEL